MQYDGTYRFGMGAAAAAVLVAVIWGCAGTGGFEGPFEDEAGRYGSQLDQTEFDQAPQALPVTALNPSFGALPAQAILTNLPAVAMQGTPTRLGSPGSCEAQSFGYGLGSYTAARNPDGTPRWDPSEPSNAASAAWLYAYAHREEGKSCPSGSLALIYLSRLTAFGAPTAQDIPYRPSCRYFNKIDLERPWPDQGKFRIGSFAALQIARDPDLALQRIKEFVANGQAVAFSGRVLQNYSRPTFESGVITSTTIVPNSGHGQLVVGYDDTIGPPGNKGALLIQNSFGTNWPPAGSGSAAPPGMAWWSYRSFTSTQLLAAVAYPADFTTTGGDEMQASTPAAPIGWVMGTSQYAPAASDETTLILQLRFEKPIALGTVSLKEPGAAGSTATAPYDEFIATGYVYLRRADGKQFLAGTYDFTLEGQTLAGVPVTYTSTVAVPASAPVARSADKMNSASNLTGTTGAAATLTP